MKNLHILSTNGNTKDTLELCIKAAIKNVISQEISIYTENEDSKDRLLKDCETKLSSAINKLVTTCLYNLRIIIKACFNRTINIEIKKAFKVFLSLLHHSIREYCTLFIDDSECNAKMDQYPYVKNLIENYLDDIILYGFLSPLANIIQRYDILSQKISLPTQITYKLTNPVKYQASLRLTSKTVERVCQEDNSPANVEDSTEFSFNWKFPIDNKINLTETVQTTHSHRSTSLPTSKTYAHILKTIQSIQAKLEVDDATIAIWLRMVIRFENDLDWLDAENLTPDNKNETVYFLIHFSHFLFGQECIRYPGAFIQHHMALDLIINERLTWAEALTPMPQESQRAYLPMALPSITPVCSSLANFYSRYTKPISHSYPGEIESITSKDTKTFLLAERRLIRDWMKLFQKVHEQREAEEKDSDDSDDPRASEFYITDDRKKTDIIKDQIPRWCPGVELT